MRALLPTLLLLACDPGGALYLEEGDPEEDTAVEDYTDTDIAPDPEPPLGCTPFGVSVADRLVVDHGSGLAAGTVETSGNPVEPTTVSVNSAAECAFDLRQGTLIGDAHFAPPGYPDVVLCRGRTSEVTGREVMLDAAVPLAAPVLPADLPANGGEKLMEWSEEATFTVDRVFDALRLRTRARLIIDGDLDIHVLGELELNNATIELTPGSRLRLWLGGDAEVLWGSRLNVAGDPDAVDLILLEGASLDLNHGSIAAAQAWAPSGAVRVQGRSTALVGTLQAAEAEVLWGARVVVASALVCP